MNEIWVEFNINNPTAKKVVAISNRGRLRRYDGKIIDSHYKQRIRINGDLFWIHRLLAEHFIPKTSKDILVGRTIIDHISHHPDGMNVNDIRNLRWCTQKENNNFPEARKNKTQGQLNRYKKKARE